MGREGGLAGVRVNCWRGVEETWPLLASHVFTDGRVERRGGRWKISHRVAHGG